MYTFRICYVTLGLLPSDFQRFKSRNIRICIARKMQHKYHFGQQFANLGFSKRWVVLCLCSCRNLWMGMRVSALYSTFSSVHYPPSMRRHMWVSQSPAQICQCGSREVRRLPFLILDLLMWCIRRFGHGQRLCYIHCLRCIFCGRLRIGAKSLTHWTRPS